MMRYVYRLKYAKTIVVSLFSVQLSNDGYLTSSLEKYNIRELNTGQRIPIDRSRINADFIGLQQWLFQRGVTKYHRFAEIILGMDKFISNPEQIFDILGFQRHPRAQGARSARST